MSLSNEMTTPYWRRLKRWWVEHEWPIIGLMLIFAIALGFWGFEKHFSALRKPASFWYLFYLSLQLVTLESGSILYPIHWQLEIARFLVPVVAGYTVLRAVFAVLQEQFQMFRLRRLSSHTVVCGLGRKGLLLARRLRERGERIVVIEKDENNPSLKSCKQDGVIVLIGDATDREMLRRAGVSRAKSILALCGQDGANAEIAVRGRELAVNGSQPVNCLAHIYEPHLCNDLRRQEILTQKHNRFRVEYFNVFEAAAAALLSQLSPLQRRDARLLIIGVGKMGESLLLRAARGWKTHYKDSKQKLPVTLLDQSAEQKLNSILSRFPHLSDVCRFDAQSIDVQSAEFYRGEFLRDERNPCRFTNIFVCFDNDSLSFSTAMALHRQTKQQDVDIIVRMTGDSGLATLLRGADSPSKEYGRLHAFALLDRTCNPDVLYAGSRETIARAIHDEYVRGLKEQNQTPEMNPSMVSWDDLPEGLKESNRRQADHIGAKLRAINCDIETLTNWDAENFQFSDDEIERMAIMEHYRWVKERESEGWTYTDGPKNLQNKTSPYLVDWEKIPERIKDYDRNAVRAIPALLANAGFQIYRSGSLKP